jgi:hypothetical protein
MSFMVDFSHSFAYNLTVAGSKLKTTDDFLLRTSLFAGLVEGLFFKNSTISYKNCAGLGLQEGLGLQKGEY